MDSERWGDFSFKRSMILALGLVSCLWVGRECVVEPFHGVGRSMWPTLSDSSQVLVNKLAYGVRSPLGTGWWWMTPPKLGDVVVAEMPELEESPFIIKRVLGLPGDEVAEINGKIYVNGQESPAPWMVEGRVGIASPNAEGRTAHSLSPSPVDGERVFQVWVVPEGHVFLVGDNRLESLDSRWFGSVPMERIMGQVWRIEEHEEWRRPWSPETP